MYFITAMSNIDNLGTFEEITLNDSDVQTIGYYETEDEALTVIGDGTVQELYYPGEYIILEKIEPGLHNSSEVVQWFKFEPMNQVYEPIKEVKSLVVNFAMIG